MKCSKSSIPARGLASSATKLLLLALSAVLLIFLPPAHGQTSPEAAQNGAVNGLVPKFIDAGGVRTRYYEYGQGEPLVLIHGGGGNSPDNANIWSKNIRPLSEHFRVIAPDRLGCGLSAGSYEDSDNYQVQADWLYNFLKAMHLNQVNLVGHSAGGAVVTWFAVEHPEMIKTLAVLSAGPETPGLRSRPSKMIAEMKTCPTKPLFAAQKCRLSLLSNDPQRAFSAQWWDAQLYMKNWRDAHYKIPNASPLNLGNPNPQFMSQLHSVWNKLRNGVLGDKPVLILYGKQDPFDWAAGAPNSDMHGAVSTMDIFGAKDPNVQLVIINDAGHFVYRDQPAAFDSDLTNFVDYWDHRLSGKAETGEVRSPAHGREASGL